MYLTILEGIELNNQESVVAFDDVALQLGNSGIARYWREIIGSSYFLQLLTENRIKPIFISRSNFRTGLLNAHKEFPHYSFRFPSLDRQIISKFCLEENVDLFVSSYYTFSNNSKNLQIVYDFIPEVFGFSRMNRGWMERELAIYAATGFFCISHNTKEDLIRFYPIHKSTPMELGYPGIDLELFSPPAGRPIRKTKKARRYFVCVGSRYGEGGYKNGDLLVKSLQSLERDEIDFDVIFIGGESLTIEELKLAKSGKVKISRVEASDEKMIQLVSEADALVYVSKYEGFGMPPLEALALGIPVICTANSSLPEAVGDMGIFVEENDFIGLAQLLTNYNFEEAKIGLQEKGHLWAQNFNWQKTIESFVESIKVNLKTPLTHSQVQRSKLLSDYTTLSTLLQN
jgi:glycosyltransferase involved in cell wall biosynthesis